MSNNYNKFFNQNRNDNRGNRQNNNTINEAIPLTVRADINSELEKKDSDITTADNLNGTSFEDQKSKEFKTGRIVNCNKLNLREDPDKNSQVLKILDSSDSILVDEISNGWAHVCIKEKKIEGYVMEEYIKIK